MPLFDRLGQHARKAWTNLLLASLLLACGLAQASGCPAEQFFAGTPPAVKVPALARESRVLCSSFFSVLYSGVSRTPIYSAAHLTAASIDLSRVQTRINSFHDDTRLPDGTGPALKDYARSGFDRGHMFPNGDAPDRLSQFESFALTNMVPQDPDSNRHLWAHIETTTRELAHASGEAYIVTGPAFLGNVSRIGHVAVPTHLWKAIYFPHAGARDGVAAAWFAPNAAGHDYEVLSIEELTHRVGIDPFPAISPAVKAAGARFPKPTERRLRDDG